MTHALTTPERPERAALRALARLAVDPRLDPVQRLALGVVMQALRDAGAPSRRDRTRGSALPESAQQDAAAFLAGDWRFRAWATAAGVDPDRLLTTLQRLGAVSPAAA